jgi:hypothetical protein
MGTRTTPMVAEMTAPLRFAAMALCAPTSAKVSRALRLATTETLMIKITAYRIALEHAAVMVCWARVKVVMTAMTTRPMTVTSAHLRAAATGWCRRPSHATTVTTSMTTAVSAPAQSHGAAMGWFVAI